MSNAHDHPAYLEGRLSYKKNRGVYSNPYEHGSEEYNIYERGWLQALKHAPESLATAMQESLNREIKQKEFQAKKELEKTKQAYANRKG